MTSQLGLALDVVVSSVEPVSEAAEAHIVRAERMAASGHSAEARYYIRRLALSALRHVRSLANGRYKDQICADRERPDAIAYARACRRFAGGAIALSSEELPYWAPVPNPHWPDLGSHGVYSEVHDYRGRKHDDFIIEVQVLPPDEHRTQCCVSKRFSTRADAEACARRWITIGTAVIAAQVAINAEAA